MTTKGCHNYECCHPSTIANMFFVLLPMMAGSPHQAASDYVLPFLAGTTSQCGGRATPMSAFQRTETRTAAAMLWCFPLPGCNQASVQAGQSCCECRDNKGWNALEEDCVRTRAVPVQAVSHLRYLWDGDFLKLWSLHGDS